ncbi:MAG: hypothetical protein ACREDZ_14130 [Kiloniellales bacterium]
MPQSFLRPSRKSNSSRFVALRVGLAAAMLLAGAAPAAAESLAQTVFFYWATAETNEGPIVVTLNDQGVWANSQETERSWHRAFRVEWTGGNGMVKDLRVFAKPGWGLGSQPDVLGTQAEIVHNVQPDVTHTLIEQGKIAQFDMVAALSSVFPYTGSSSTPAGVCQLKRNELLANGTLPYDILANDWLVEKEASAKAILDYYKDYTLDQYGVAIGHDQAQVSATAVLKFSVLCKGDKAIAEALQPNYQGAYATGFQVTGAKLFIAPAYKSLTADCPVTVPLVAELTATNTGTLKFRFVSASGKVSQLYTANITGQTGGVYKTLYEKQIQVPLTQASGMGGGGGGGGGIVDQQGGGGFAVQTQPEEPIVPTAPSSGGMGQVQVNPLAGNIHSESFRVEVVQPATGIVSGYAGYRITCKPKATPGIGGAQGLTLQRPAPQPGGTTPVIGGMRSAQPPQPPTTPQRVAPARVAPPVQIAPPQPMQMQSVPPQQ